MDVNFFEQQSYYPTTVVQGESTSEEHQFWDIIETQPSYDLHAPYVSNKSPSTSNSVIKSLESPVTVTESLESPVETLPQTPSQELLNISPSPSNPPEPLAKNSELHVYSKGKWHRKETAQRALPEQLQESEPTPSPPEILQGNSQPDSFTHESPSNQIGRAHV